MDNGVKTLILWIQEPILGLVIQNNFTPWIRTRIDLSIITVDRNSKVSL